MFEVITDSTEVAHVYTRVFKDLEDLTLVDIQYKEKLTQRRIDHIGLDKALQIVTSDRVFVLYGFDSQERLMSDPRFVALMGYKNVGYIRAPFRIQEVREMYQQLKDGTKPEDRLAQELFRVEMVDRGVATLKHDHKYAMTNPERMEGWLAKAHGLGFEGTDDEVVSAVFAWERKTAGQFVGQFFEGVFVDVYGTLLKADETLNEAVKEKVIELAAGKSITIWTDSDLRIIATKLRSLGLGWKLVSKFDFQWAEVEIAIDDLPQAEFEQQFGVKVRQYHQV